MAGGHGGMAPEEEVSHGRAHDLAASNHHGVFPRHRHAYAKPELTNDSNFPTFLSGFCRGLQLSSVHATCAEFHFITLHYSWIRASTTHTTEKMSPAKALQWLRKPIKVSDMQTVMPANSLPCNDWISCSANLSV